MDSRAALNATVDDLSEAAVREHLRACGSALLDEPDARTIYRKMDIVRRVNDHDVPRNVALLFFSRDPARWFPGAIVETSILQAGAGGDVIQEKEFRGGLADQVRGCLAYLRREVIGSRIEKVSHQIRASHQPNYPDEALREVLVNALFHRRYSEDSPHTTLVRITSDQIDIRSTPGPVAGIDHDQLQRGATLRLVPPRNPRIGELFKETGLAEKRLTGLGKVFQAMERNGSPPPRFYFDEQRTFFQATLFAHPWQSAASAIRKAGELRAVGRPDEALDALESAWRGNPTSNVLAEEFIRHCVAGGELGRAEPVIENTLDIEDDSQRPQVVAPWLEALVADGQHDRARRFLEHTGTRLSPGEAIGAAIVARRLGDPDTAAKLFDVAGPLILEDPRPLLESAQNKLYLAERAHRSGRSARSLELLRDTSLLLERVLRMDAPRRRHAWAWRELARVRRRLGASASAVDEAYANATELAWDETRFWNEWAQFSARGSLALLDRQNQHLQDLTAPEHLSGPQALDEQEYGKQEATLEALKRRADILKSALTAAIANPDARIRPLLDDLVTAQTRLERAGPLCIGANLEAAKELTSSVLSTPDLLHTRTVDAKESGAFVAVARALADLNMHYLEWLRPRSDRS